MHRLSQTPKYIQTSYWDIGREKPAGQPGYPMSTWVHHHHSTLPTRDTQPLASVCAADNVLQPNLFTPSLQDPPSLLVPRETRAKWNTSLQLLLG